jgi:GntR family transcriptional regulator
MRRWKRRQPARCARCSGLSALLLNAEQAKLLQSKEGDAGLCVERLGFLRDGRAVEFCRSYFRGDMYDFVAELNAT